MFKRCLALSGVYDIRRFMDGDYDDNFYFNNPVDYMASLSDPWYLDHLAQLRHPPRDRERPVRGLGSDLPSLRGPEREGESATPWTTGARDGGHDWPYWKRQMNEYLARLPW